MKFFSFRKTIPLVLLCMFLLGVLLTATACEPGGYPVIENQGSRDLKIFIMHVRDDGTLEEPKNYEIVTANTTKTLGAIVFVRREWVYRIQAVDSLGEVVFLHDYNMNDLEKIGWKITMPP